MVLRGGSQLEFAARIVATYDDEVCVRTVDELVGDPCFRVHVSDRAAGHCGKDPLVVLRARG